MKIEPRDQASWKSLSFHVKLRSTPLIRGSFDPYYSTSSLWSCGLLVSKLPECLSAYAEVSSPPSIATRKLTPLPEAICAGKHAIAEYLIQHEGFQLLELATKPHQRITDEPDDDLLLQAPDRKDREGPSDFVFDTPEALLDFVTKRWQEKWVTTDIADGQTLDRFLLRPFFLLVSVDAPVSLRWKRFSDRYVAPSQHDLK